MHHLKLLISSMFVILLSNLALADIADSDSGIFGPKYVEILGKMDTWQETYSELVQVIEYGKSVENRPLRLVLVMKKMNVSSRPTLLMSGSTHGNEYLAIEDRLPEEILKRTRSDRNIQNFLNKGGAFIFIPILNPDGYENRERENAHGKDLNRDWDLEPINFKGFTQIETRALSEKLDALTQSPYNLRFNVTVDYHCCIGAILYPWSYTAKAIPQKDLAKHVDIAEIAKAKLNIEHGTSNDILGYMSVGTTKDYYYAKYHSVTFTYEGRFKEEDKLLSKHLSWWQDMVKSQIQEPEQQFFTLLKDPLPFLRSLAE